MNTGPYVFVSLNGVIVRLDTIEAITGDARTATLWLASGSTVRVPLEAGQDPAWVLEQLKRASLPERLRGES